MLGDQFSLWLHNRGLLRDLKVFYTIDLNQQIYKEELDNLKIDFKNLSEDICPKISFLKLEIDKAPKTYKSYLNDYFVDLDYKKNNFFTDISNYLSYETGQPTHCYEENTINSKLTFHVSDKKEHFQTLLDKDIVLNGKNYVFSSNNKVVNLAGVVGSKSTACSVNTKTVLVECAFFQPEAIIGKSVKYDIQSDASYKFERGVDINSHERVLRRFVEIVSEHANIKHASIALYDYRNINPVKIPIKLNLINKIIGIDLTEKEYLNYLTKLGFVFDNGFIIVPSFRNDIKTQNDIAEEIARVVGYDNIRRSEINIPKGDNLNYKDKENKLRYFLLDHGFYEVINSPFVSTAGEKSIKVDNPLDSNRQFLRTNLTESLLDNLLYNERRQKDSIKLFEISDIYLSDDGLSKKKNLSVIASGRVGLNYQDFSRKIDKKYLQNMFKKILPTEVFDIRVLSRDVLNTKLKNEIISLEIDIDKISNDILSYNEQSKPPSTYSQYVPISDLPSSHKDISYLVKDFSKIQNLQDFILNYKHKIVKNAFIFDYFNNKKSHEIKIGFRIIFQSKESTITSSEIDIIYNDIIDKSLKIKGISIPGRPEGIWA